MQFSSHHLSNKRPRIPTSNIRTSSVQHCLASSHRTASHLISHGTEREHACMFVFGLCFGFRGLRGWGSDGGRRNGVRLCAKTLTLHRPLFIFPFTIITSPNCVCLLAVSLQATWIAWKANLESLRLLLAPTPSASHPQVYWRNSQSERFFDTNFKAYPTRSHRLRSSSFKKLVARSGHSLRTLSSLHLRRSSYDHPKTRHSCDTQPYHLVDGTRSCSRSLMSRYYMRGPKIRMAPTDLPFS